MNVERLPERGRSRARSNTGALYSLCSLPLMSPQLSAGVDLATMRKHYKGDDPHAIHEAAQRVEAPLSDFMVRLFAEELPFLDSASRTRVYDILREHKAAGRGVISSQEELPAEIRELMDL